MPAPIALQLYTIRDATAKDFAASLQRVADIGYLGVELAGFSGTTPEAAAHLFRHLDLKVVAAHAPLPLGKEQKPLLDSLLNYCSAVATACPRLVCPWQPPELFQTVEGIRQVCRQLNAANSELLFRGMALGYHNHWAEFTLVDGRPAYEWMAEFLEADVFFEVDTYWVKTAGSELLFRSGLLFRLDPAEVVRKLGERAPLLHIKDGPCLRDAPMTAVGQGVMDFPAIVAAAEGRTEWMIVELDSCATDMWKAVEESYRYLIEKGLAYGRKN